MNIQYRFTSGTLLISAITLIACPVLLSAAAETTKPSAPPAQAAAAPSSKTAATPPAAPPAKAEPAPAPAPAKVQPPTAVAVKPAAPDTRGRAANTEPIHLPTVNVEAVRLEEVEVSEALPTATGMAPTSSNLDTYQPQTIVDLAYITNHLPPTADFTTIASVGPSAANIVSNGPGLSEARRATIRGFAQNQYNVTYDGIPFQDSDDFTHHSVSYFPAKMVGRVTVDRGPGTASTLGVATFGGTVGLSSKDPRSEMTLIPSVTYGSYNTMLGHLEGSTGLLNSIGGASAIGSVQYLRSDGYQTNVYVKRLTSYVKYLQPLSKSTTLTFLSNYNNSKFGAAQPVSQLQIDTLGRNFGLTNNPVDLLYKGYNKRVQTTDFEYIGLDSALTDTLHLDAKVYTYYYNNDNFGSLILNANSTSTGPANQPWHAGDHIGRLTHVDYRSLGEVITAAWDNKYGVLKFGFWHDYQRAPRYQVNIDFTKGDIYDFDPASNVSTAYSYKQLTYNYVNELFAEYDWRPLKNLIINFGVKNVSFKRKYDAVKNQTTGVPLYYTQKMSKTLGLGAINYSIQDDWTVYGQIAQGFLAPNQNQLYVRDPSLNKAKPQETMNYQLGTVYKKNRLNAAFDYYWIDFKNYPHSSIDLSTGLTNVVLAKGAYFSGVESEITFYVGNGFSLYTNGSINDAKFKKSKLKVNLVPSTTGSVGLLYEKGGFFASLINKYTGNQKIYYTRAPLVFNPDDASTVTKRYTSGGYAMTNLSLGYGRKLSMGFIKSVKIRLELDNITNRKVQVIDNINGAAPNAANGLILYSVLPTRNYFVSVSGEF